MYILLTRVYYTMFFFFFLCVFQFCFVDELAIQVAYSPRDFATSLATYAGCEYKQKIMFSNFFVTSYIEL